MATLRPALELADVIRRFGPDLGDLPSQQRRVLDDLCACRTAALGGHLEVCDHCQHQRPAYNSCRNRHCPRCQGSACARWMEDRAGELLPVEYFHVVFTLPDDFNRLCLSCPSTLYGMLFTAAARTLLEVAANPKHLGADIGFMSILHTWGQDLCLHPHLHCVVPGGGLSPDGQRWVSCRPGFFLPVRILSRVFRGKFIELLREKARAGELGTWTAAAVEELIVSSIRREWVVYAKPPFGGPERVLKYLSRYTHKIAISNRRLLAMDERTVTFSRKDYAQGGRQRQVTLGGGEFLRRFLMHVVPRGFVRIRHFGLLANRCRNANLERCRRLLGVTAMAGEPACPIAVVLDTVAAAQTDLCPVCGKGHMIKTRLLPRRPDLLPPRARCDSS